MVSWRYPNHLPSIMSFDGCEGKPIPATAKPERFREPYSRGIPMLASDGSVATVGASWPRLAEDTGERA